MQLVLKFLSDWCLPGDQSWAGDGIPYIYGPFAGPQSRSKEEEHYGPFAGPQSRSREEEHIFILQSSNTF